MKNKIEAVIHYDKLGWRVIPLKGKIPYWEGWSKAKHENNETIKELARNPSLNVGILCGEPSKIIAIDVDQPKILGYDPKQAIKLGALAHTTSKGVRLVFRSSNPEVLNFSRKVVRKREDLDESRLVRDGDKLMITLVEILGTGRQFLAPPSTHPETNEQFRWITPLPQNPEDIMSIEDLKQLKEILLNCFENKEVVFELFDDKGKIEEQRMTNTPYILEKWMEKIERSLEKKLVADRGYYKVYHCPFHQPDNNPSFALYKNTYIGYDFHDGRLYTLKELAKSLNIELPRIEYVEVELKDIKAQITLRDNLYVKFKVDNKQTPEIKIGKIDSAELSTGSISQTLHYLKAIGVEMEEKKCKELLILLKTKISNDDKIRKTLQKIAEEWKDEEYENIDEFDLISILKFDVFRDQYGYTYAAIRKGEAVEIIPIRSKKFKNFISYKYYKLTGMSASTEKLSSMLNTLEGQALFEGAEHRLNNRIAWFDEAIFYDLGDSEWRVVKITKEGWKIIPHPQPIFRRFQNTKPQITPEKAEPNDFKRLTKHLNIKEEDEVVLLSTIASYIVPNIPHPIIDFYGEHGDCKSTNSQIIKRLIDPATPELLSLPNDKKEFVQLLYHHYLAVFDNVSKLAEWQSDLLCQAVTGGGFQKRMLYTDDDDVIYDFMRCIILNGINIVTTKPDLLDRTILVEVPHITHESRKTEKEIWETFQKDLPYILGGLFTTISKAINLIKQIRLELKPPRMADFCVWGEAIARVLGYKPFEFYNAYLNKIQSHDIDIVESDIVGELLLSYIYENGKWEGTATQLLAELKMYAENNGIDVKGKGFPRLPNRLMRKINELKPNLRRLGITIEKDRDDKGRKLLRIMSKRHINNETLSSESSLSPECEIGEIKSSIPDFESSGSSFGEPSGWEVEDAILSSSPLKPIENGIDDKKSEINHKNSINQETDDKDDTDDSLTNSIHALKQDIHNYDKLPIEERVKILKELWQEIDKKTRKKKQDVFIKFLELRIGDNRKQIAYDVLKLIEQGELPVILRKAVEDWIIVIDNFEFERDGFVTYYTCKRCSFRVISVKDAISHSKVCKNNQEWWKKERGKRQLGEVVNFKVAENCLNYPEIEIDNKRIKLEPGLVFEAPRKVAESLEYYGYGEIV